MTQHYVMAAASALLFVWAGLGYLTRGQRVRELEAERDRLKRENAALRRWSEEQARVPELGAYRSPEQIMGKSKQPYLFPDATDHDRHMRIESFMVQERVVGRAAQPARPEPPAPTTVPGPGRKVQT